jgi:hypothetical protein
VRRPADTPGQGLSHEGVAWEGGSMAVKSLLEEAAQALAALVAARAAAGDPVLKTEAEVFLCQKQALKRREARQLITAQRERLWRMVPSPRGRGKGHAQALWPVDPSPPRPTADGKQNDVMEAAPDNGSRGTLSAALDGSERQTNQPAIPCDTGVQEDDVVCRTPGGIDAPASTADPCRCGGARWYLTPEGWELCRPCHTRQW